MANLYCRNINGEQNVLQGNGWYIDNCLLDVLTLGPSIFLYFFIPLYVFLTRKINKKIHHTVLNISKTVIQLACAVLVLMETSFRLKHFSTLSSNTFINIFSIIFLFTSELSSGFLIQYDRMHHRPHNVLQLTYKLLCVFVGAFNVALHLNNRPHQFRKLQSIFSFFYLLCNITLCLLNAFSVDRRFPNGSASTGKDASLASLATFWWFGSFLWRTGRGKNMEEGVRPLKTSLTSEHLTALYQTSCTKCNYKLYGNAPKNARNNLNTPRYDSCRKEHEKGVNNEKNVFYEKKNNVAEKNEMFCADAVKVKFLPAVFNEKSKKIHASKHANNKNGSNQSNQCNTKEKYALKNFESKEAKKERNRFGLTGVLVRCLGVSYAKSAFINILSDIIMFAVPVLLREIIVNSSNSLLSTVQVMTYVLLLFASSCVHTLLKNHYLLGYDLIAFRVHTMLYSAIYRKLLHSSSTHSSSLGSVVNLMTLDVQKVVEVVSMLNYLWSFPLQTCLCLHLLWELLGPASLVALVVMVAMLPVNSWVAAKCKSFQVKQMNFKDARIKLMDEVINGIKLIKLYAWEDCFLSRMAQTRSEEIKVLLKTAYLSAVATFAWSSTPLLISATTFAVYVTTSSSALTADKAFVSISLFNILRGPLSMLPVFVSNFAVAKVSLKRLEEFLSGEDEHGEPMKRRKDDDQMKLYCTEDHLDRDYAIRLEGVDVAWKARGELNTVLHKFRSTLFAIHLEFLNLDVKRGEMVAVVGAVGSGKSSLLSALLNEAVVVAGKLELKGSLAYASQEAWLQHRSIRENILFGDEMNAPRYKMVLTACCLDEDLEKMPEGDLTEMGENGVNLSGGQKHRVCLARLAYREADVCLMDDPFSSLDNHVAMQLFLNVFSDETGFLKDKTRIIVTNNTQLLAHFGTIVVLSKEGSIALKGSFQQVSSHADFINITKHAATIEGCEDGNREFIGRAVEVDGCKREGEKSELKSGNEYSSSTSAIRLSKGENDAKVSNVKCDNSIKVRKIIEDEVVKTGKVSKRVYKGYLSSIGSCFCLLAFCTCLINNLLLISSNVWLSQWSNDAYMHNESISNEEINNTVNDYSKFTPHPNNNFSFINYFHESNSTSKQMADGVNNNGNNYNNNNNNSNGSITSWGSSSQRLAIYSTLGVLFGLTLLARSLAVAAACARASEAVYRRVVSALLWAPLSFYEATPSARIVNRLSTDVATVDFTLPFTVSGFVNIFLMATLSFAVIAYNLPLLLVPTLPLFILHKVVQNYYRSTVRQLRRLESNKRSLLLSHVGESIRGLSIIRAWAELKSFDDVMKSKVDDLQSVRYLGIVSQRWLSVWLGLVGNFLVLCASSMAVSARLQLSPGVVGMVLTYSFDIVQNVNSLLSMHCELETGMVAAERLLEYATVKPEAQHRGRLVEPSYNWTADGRIEFRNFSAKFRSSSGHVLKEINLSIKSGEKIGIVGRTGAGKSSLLMSLLRALHPTDNDDHNGADNDGTKNKIKRENLCNICWGCCRRKKEENAVLMNASKVTSKGNSGVFIDGVNIAKVAVSRLRSSVSIILQDPVLFTDSIRFNLDPTNKHSDHLMWACLERVCLKEYVSSLPGKLDHVLKKGELSSGQKQLLCFVRALLRQSRILILDEATASVDPATQDIILTLFNTGLGGAVASGGDRLRTYHARSSPFDVSRDESVESVSGSRESDENDFNTRVNFHAVVNEEYSMEDSNVEARVNNSQKFENDISENMENYLEKYLKTCTMLTVAHRMSNVLNCDRVVVMDAGRLVEIGVPGELLKSNTSLFYKMFNNVSPAE